jgi:extracellular factor (EF) 3-hydroxypalmitic acid methyl ester biosynthesis protein
VAFLDAFGPQHRTLFEAAGTVLPLAKGQLLIRRGEPGGDVYLLRKGTLEILDTRAAKEVILRTLPEGTVVGEMAFVDDSPRSADVRSPGEAEVLRWTQRDLRALLSRHPDLAAVFYHEVARLASDRIRFLTEGAVSGAFGDQSTVPEEDEVRDQIPAVCDPVKSTLPSVELALRRDPEDAEARARLDQVLDDLEKRVADLFLGLRDPATQRLAADLLSRELHPYLVRSSLAERSIRRPQGTVATAEVMAHVLVNTAGGDGRLGELLDRWLLDRPTFQALRRMKQAVTDVFPGQLPSHRNRRALLVNVGTGSLVASLVDPLQHPPTLLTVMDQTREALSLVDVGLVDRPKGCEIQTVQENLVAWALGRGRMDLQKQDGIVLHGLFEYLPDRIAVSLLEVCRGLLSPDGVLVLATLGPSRDRDLLDRLLAWPTVRRADTNLRTLLAGAGLKVSFRMVLPEPATVIVATRAS